VYWNWVRDARPPTRTSLRRLQEQLRAGDLVELGAQTRNDLVGILGSLLARLQG
jgi:hypothetical protein